MIESAVDGSSREAIARVATRLFAQHGYAGTSLRMIAAEVGLDPALTIRYFGSKESLFLETISLDGRFATLFEGPIDDLGRRILLSLLNGRDTTMLDYFAALVRCSDLALVQQRLRDTAATGFLAPLIRRLGGAGADLRARLILAQVNGLLVQLAVVVDPVLRAQSAEQIADAYAPALQALIDG